METTTPRTTTRVAETVGTEIIAAAKRNVSANSKYAVTTTAYSYTSQTTTTTTKTTKAPKKKASEAKHPKN